MEIKNRRNFLKKAALAPLCLSFGTNSWPIIPDSTNEVAPNATSKIKLSLNAWSYNVPLYKHINGESGGMSLFDLLEECAKLDFDAVDPTGYFFPGYPEVPKTKFVNDFKRRAFQLGLDISGTGIRNDFANSNKEERHADIELAKRWIEAAAEMGAPVLRVFAGQRPEGYSWDDTAVWMADALGECAAHGEKFGVLIGVQNHGGMLKSADEVLKVLDMVSSDWLGAIVDTGYFLTDDPYSDIARVIPKAVNWQVKSLLSDRRGGPIDLQKLVAIIRASHYRGYLPIEALPILGKEEEFDAYTQVPELLGKLRKALR
ncbi:Tat (twin-arginine translocation) pathway signal sequence [Pricia antarctica]|uniref:Tat (Twin-arginine translocation) pathway signal sequence n=1 Tax=Pricia antarctica TaxID=641691 RepID=A0A1G6YCZ8_9FLAO|nr:sugar phosphate isomerase/epimerase family protein [Pricia antarctica]SDD87475.1 Tat (twin-arginine translocation) pathway signal sequence [Pricia antarctica]